MHLNITNIEKDGDMGVLILKDTFPGGMSSKSLIELIDACMFATPYLFDEKLQKDGKDAGKLRVVCLINSQILQIIKRLKRIPPDDSVTALLKIMESLKCSAEPDNN